MKFPIDLAYLDGNLRVRKLVENLQPSRISICVWSKSVIELPPGTIAKTATQVGDQFSFSPAT